jgi:hypothetical protein
MPKRHYTVKEFSGGMVATQPGSDIQPNEYMFGYDIDPSYPGGLRGRKGDENLNTGILGSPLIAVRAELDTACQVIQTSTNLYKLGDAGGAATGIALTSGGSGALEPNNKAVHIGRGSGLSAKWYGMVAHTQFGVGPSGPAEYDSELAPPAFTGSGSMFGLGYKGANNFGTGLVYINTDRKRLSLFTTTAHTHTSGELFKNATAICNDGVQSGRVLVFDSETNTLYRINTSSWAIEQSMVLNSLAAEEYIVSDIEVTNSHVYFIVSTVAGNLKEGNTEDGKGRVPVNWLYRIDKTFTGGGSLTNVTPKFEDSEFYFKYTGLSEYVKLNSGSILNYNIKCTTSRRSLFRIGTSDIGVYVNLEASAGLIKNDDTYDYVTGSFYYRNGSLTQNLLQGTLVIRTGSQSNSSVLPDGYVHSINGATASTDTITWLSWESGILYKSLFSSTTGQVSYSTCSIALTSASSSAASFSGATGVSTSAVKNAASIRYSGNYYHMNGDGSMYPSGRFVSNTGTEIAGSIATIDIQTQDNGFSEAEITYHYRFSYLYDSYQESPLSSGSSQITPGNAKKMFITVYIPSGISRRVSHINIYRAQSSGNALSFYQLLETVSLSTNITSTNVSFGSTTISGRPFTYTDNYTINQLGPTYESNAGIPETLSTTTVRYGLSSQINGYHFVGDCSHTVIPDAGQYLFRSVQGQFDNFNYLSNLLRLPEKPIALATFRSRLYAFGKNRIWRIEPNEFYIEDEMVGYGANNSSAVVVTEFGMFFAGPNGIYYTDGGVPKDISYPINRNYSNESFGELNPAYLDRQANNVHAGYDPRNRIVLFAYMPVGATSYRMLAYSIDQQRWDFWDGTTLGNACGAFSSLSNGIPTIVSQTGHRVTVATSTTAKNITYYGPWLDMDEPGSEKWFYEVKLQFRDNHIFTSNGSILVEIDGEGIVSLTANAVLEEGTALPSTGKDAIYRYAIPQSSGQYRKGKRIRLAFTGIQPIKVDSYSIVYREKMFKGGL